jgi:hypothetical protein
MNKVYFRLLVSLLKKRITTPLCTFGMGLGLA